MNLDKSKESLNEPNKLKWALMSLNELRAVCWSLNEPKTKMGLNKPKWAQKTLNIFKVTLYELKMGLYELKWDKV